MPDNPFGLAKLLATLVESRIPGILGHAERVARWSAALARVAGLSPEDAAQIELAGWLHDAGESGIPPAILVKAIGTLTDREREQYRRHPVYGALMAQEIAGEETAARLIRHHHENYDGQGFPDGLAGDAIALGSRILTVADVWDRLLFPRDESHPLPLAEAEKRLRRAQGVTIDPGLTDAFLRDVVPVCGFGERDHVPVSVECLRQGMELARDVNGPDGARFLRAGTKLYKKLIDQLLHDRHSFDPLVTRFYLPAAALIPVRPPPAADAPPPAAPENAPANSAAASVSPETPDAGPSAPGGRPLVVVVDDEANVTRALRRELRSAGYDVMAFLDSAAALEELKNFDRPIYAVISDFNMPGLQGDQFLAQFQRDHPRTPCLVLTGLATRDNVVRLANAASITRILTKPWNAETLRATLAALNRSGAPS